MVVFETFVFYYFFGSVLYVLILAIAGCTYKRKIYTKSAFKKIAVFVPGYKEDGVICFVAEQLSQLQYPQDLFDIIVIADSFKPDTLQKLSHLPITLMPVKFEKSSKAKSLNYALETLAEPYDIAVILDADNITQPDFLVRINDAINSGIRVVQAQRVAKNTNTSFAILDACSEAINNHIFRKGPNALGLSSSLIGSGMAFDFALLKDILPKIESVYEDRELQFELAKRGHKITYLDGVLVYDEKIDNSSSFQNQRRRWLFAQAETLIHNFIPGHVMLAKGNFNFYNFSVLNNLFPPRIMTLVLLFLISITTAILQTNLFIYWSGLFLIFCTALAISIPVQLYNKNLLIAIFSIPKAFTKMFSALFKLKGARTFIHTTHTKVDIDSVFKSK
ncbi:MAG: glycosyltransferase [Cyclobacteriaceae bacterium]|nr:glycosyltransferase [Cyclobacteriaceae bacterium]